MIQTPAADTPSTEPVVPDDELLVAAILMDSMHGAYDDGGQSYGPNLRDCLSLSKRIVSALRAGEHQEALEKILSDRDALASSEAESLKNLSGHRLPL